jgi:hypothetical protein
MARKHRSRRELFRDFGLSAILMGSLGIVLYLGAASTRSAHSKHYFREPPSLNDLPEGLVEALPLQAGYLDSRTGLESLHGVRSEDFRDSGSKASDPRLAFLVIGDSQDVLFHWQSFGLGPPEVESWQVTIDGRETGQAVLMETASKDEETSSKVSETIRVPVGASNTLHQMVTRIPPAAFGDLSSNVAQIVMTNVKVHANGIKLNRNAVQPNDNTYSVLNEGAEFRMRLIPVTSAQANMRDSWIAHNGRSHFEAIAKYEWLWFFSWFGLGTVLLIISCRMPRSSD